MKNILLVPALIVLLSCNRDRIAANDTAEQSGANKRVVPTDSMPPVQATTTTELVPVAEPPKDIPEAPAGDIKVGQSVYRKQCASCHGADGKTPTGKFILASGPTQAREDSELADAIRAAPSHKRLRLNDGEANGVVTYVKALQ